MGKSEKKILGNFSENRGLDRFKVVCNKSGIRGWTTMSWSYMW